ncbi:MAG TPA: carboxymuconolactone decarboxylase family protein [Noviherbaspirillum sp.]|jgi:4-carboxymuconolactone decarboxylase|uniref:carboxymuconolactone decarboxylase family protein n=1 Tax=Noviherbaspirillum sp. TaxID=1926288 RepID=UPI002DDD3838|nr:carboxymuconolactone decarboxylase family protein [Noviherbaspirillum sp.]HEV2611882.1 carboxymuconolactone decarboxylase family protein [Noviherbaspirillum sp.]
MNNRFISLSILALSMVTATVTTTSAADDAIDARRAKGEATIAKLSGGAGQPVLNALRQDFPVLADGIVDYSLGDVWSRGVLDDRTRQLAAVAAFAAQGNATVLKIHAGYALKLGATEEELKEIVYLTTVTAGFPRAIDAAQALREVFAARRTDSAPR